MIFAPTAARAAAAAPPRAHGDPEADEAPLSAPASCGARRRGASCGLEVLHDGDHAEDRADDPAADRAGGGRRWPRGRREQVRRDALAAELQRLRERAAEALEV